MKKTALATALAVSLGTAAITVEAGTPGITGVFNDQYIFSMTDPNDAPVGTPTPPQDWVFDFDNGTVSITNTATFYASVWTAHDVTFTDNGDGTYSGIPGAPNMLFDWSVNANIPVEIVWDITLLPGNLINVSTVSTVILPNSPAFPGFQPAFDSASAAVITCGEFFATTEIEKTVDIDITTDLLDTCALVDGTAALDSFTQPTNGTVTDDGASLIYQPNTGFSGLDKFTYTAKDDSATSNPAEVSVQVGGELLGNFTMLDSAGDTFGGTNDVVFTFAAGVDPEAGTGLNTDESDTNFGKLTIVSKRPQPFNGFVWDAHSIRVFGPGTYAFDSGCTKDELLNTGCPAGSVGGKTISMIVGPNQIGAHILFDWNTSKNIDVVNVWNKNAIWDRLGHTGNTNKLFAGAAGVPAADDAVFELVSTDVTGFTTPDGVLMPAGDGLNSAPMVDGPFEKFYANFNNKPDKGKDGADVVTITARDTKLGDSILASLDLYALFIGIMSLLGFRRFSKK
jgi:hypothetical protein